MNAIPSLMHHALVQPPGVSRLTIDYESFYDTQVSLSKMTVLEYLHHMQFELIGASLRFDTHPIGAKADSANRPFSSKAKWVERGQLAPLLASYDWSRIILVSHNVLFDGALLAWLFGYVPAMYLDTLGMARALVYPYTGRASLEAVADYLGLPRKQKDVIIQARGWTLDMFRANPTKYIKYQVYCEHDSDLCAGIVDKLAPQMPPEELIINDMVVRMGILPQFLLDLPVLRAHLKDVRAKKAALMERLDALSAGKRDLMSDEKLAELLRYLGVDPPTKWSPKKEAVVYAFAKTDREFTDLAEDEDPLVQALVGARLGHKSTIEETRTERFIGVAEVQWSPASHGAMLPCVADQPLRMPFPLRYSGAHTHRLSGEWKLNLQNLRRKSPLRRALKAPPDYEVVSADAAQIEARVVCEIAGAKRVLNDFRMKNDPYTRLAEVIWSVQTNAFHKDTHPDERFVGKTGVLGLGFGMGPPKFIVTCWNQGRKVITPEVSAKAVKAYRQDYAPEVPQYWKLAERMIDCMIRGESMVAGPITVIGQRIILPNGMALHYNNIHRETRPAPWGRGQTTEQAIFTFGDRPVYLFGGKLTENIVQALARIITMQAALRIRRMYPKIPLAGQVHDQLIYVVHKSESRAFLDQVLIPEMCKAPDWLPNIPLDAEGAIGANLLDAK